MKTEFQTEFHLLLLGSRLVLCSDGTALLCQAQTLLVADLHLGKDASFRSRGIPVPSAINRSTFDLLTEALEKSNARRLVFLGDLIHDQYSLSEMLVEEFAQWRQRHSQTQMTLVRGNHDRHVASFPQKWNLEVVQHLDITPFHLVHEVPIDTFEPNDPSIQKSFQIGGHWHPVIHLGSGADQIRLPCFALRDETLTLPAFGKFKGGMKQQLSPGSTFFPICDNRIWRVEP